jgi:hypothetical protein
LTLLDFDPVVVASYAALRAGDIPATGPLI